jgi:proteasome lid subunit RPN8/RPN11
MTTVLPIHAYLLDSVAAHGRTEYPREACGFLCGPHRTGRPDRFVPIPNRHAHPERYYVMSDDAVVNAYGVMDELHQDPIVVYHTHTHTGSELSMTDIWNAWNLDAIYLICSLEKSQSQPVFQAWRIIEEQYDPENPPQEDRGKQCIFVDEHAGRMRYVEEVALDIIDDGHHDSPIHGLIEGNKIRIVWDSDLGRRTTVATVGPRADGGEAVRIYPVRPGLAGPILDISLNRIRSVGILTEGPNQAGMRAQAASFLQEAALRLAACDTTGARDAVRRAGLLLPRIIPTSPPQPRAYRPRRKGEE